jgi:hypothetical protein
MPLQNWTDADRARGSIGWIQAACLRAFVAAKGADLTTSQLVPAYWQRAKGAAKGPKPKGQP